LPAQGDSLIIELKGLKIMRKVLITVGSLILVAIVIYVWSWEEVNIKTNKYYNDAIESYRSGDYITALKGKGSSGLETNSISKGGFQNVVQAWSAPYAAPKPAEYKESLGKIDELINQKLTIELGEKIYDKYVGIDDAYLPQVMVRVGDLYKEKGDLEKAKLWYNRVIDNYSLYGDAKQLAENRLNSLK
jgi:tetratricopeptide (TPR) repeat protein